MASHCGVSDAKAEANEMIKPLCAASGGARGKTTGWPQHPERDDEGIRKVTNEGMRDDLQFRLVARRICIIAVCMHAALRALALNH